MPPKTHEKKKICCSSRFPSWLHHQIPQGKALYDTSQIIKKHNIHTVCEKAKCPNRARCYANKTATFLALGKECTRACGFCDIDFSKNPKALDPLEPNNIAFAAKTLGLEHVVITMVSRDDLKKDQGAGQIAKIIRRLRELIPSCTVEVLTSDFSGQTQLLDIVLGEKPDIFNHNIETVRRLTPRIRHKAQYDRSLKILKHAKKSKKTRLIKSGIMVGLGEEPQEIKQTISDLYYIGADIVTIGQYLQASRKKLKIVKFIHPTQFKEYETYGHDLGIKYMYCGPFVRSSFNALETQKRALTKS